MILLYPLIEMLYLGQKNIMKDTNRVTFSLPNTHTHTHTHEHVPPVAYKMVLKFNIFLFSIKKTFLLLISLCFGAVMHCAVLSVKNLKKNREINSHLNLLWLNYTWTGAMFTAIALVSIIGTLMIWFSQWGAGYCLVKTSKLIIPPVYWDYRRVTLI